MAVSSEELEQIIRENFPKAIIKITDLAGDGDHYALEVTDESFISMSLIERHRKIKEALREMLHDKLHAITIKANLP